MSGAASKKKAVPTASMVVDKAEQDAVDAENASSSSCEIVGVDGHKKETEKPASETHTNTRRFMKEQEAFERHASHELKTDAIFVQKTYDCSIMTRLSNKMQIKMHINLYVS